MTPEWNNYYVNSHDLVIAQNRKFNKYFNFLSKILWFYPNLEDHKYWRDSSKHEKHGYNKYLNEFHSSCIIDNEFKEIEVENLIKENKQRMKILILCLIFHPHMRLQYIVYH